jgi:UDP-glucose 4-epimerase
MTEKPILITGGAGYIGSHTCVALCEAGFTPVIFDNFCNSTISVIQKIETLTKKSVAVIQGDIRNEALLQKTLEDYSCEAVIHFAGLKAVGESVAEPLKYYDVNVSGSLTLLRAMQKTQVKKLVFSSSAAVYGSVQELPIKESAPCLPVNPYGRSKFIVEEMLADLVQADPTWSVTSLRYFNPIGAHPSGLIGEKPQGVPSNLMPYLTQTAAGLRKELSIFGTDYPTQDGSAVRDYIHVMDLAEGHVAALDFLENSTAGANSSVTPVLASSSTSLYTAELCAEAPCSSSPAAIFERSPLHQSRSGMITLNLGTGKGYSVLEMVAAFEKITGEKVPCKIVPRRAGDVAACWADPTAAEQVLKWKATRDLEAMCRDSWNWQQQDGKIL